MPLSAANVANLKTNKKLLFCTGVQCAGRHCSIDVTQKNQTEILSPFFQLLVLIITSTSCPSLSSSSNSSYIYIELIFIFRYNIFTNRAAFVSAALFNSPDRSSCLQYLSVSGQSSLQSVLRLFHNPFL